MQSIDGSEMRSEHILSHNQESTRGEGSAGNHTIIGLVYNWNPVFLRECLCSA